MMPDREKVIKEKLDEMVELTRGLNYVTFMTAVENANDILELMKEQEAVYPSWQNGKMYCGHCGSKFPPRVGMRFCHRCGMPIKLKVNDIVEQEGR